MYSLTYKFEDLLVCYGHYPYGGTAEATGTAEISFDRDRDWTIDSVTIAYACDPKTNQHVPVERFNQDAPANELYCQQAGDISAAVCEADIPPIAEEIAEARYEHGRDA